MWRESIGAAPDFLRIPLNGKCGPKAVPIFKLLEFCDDGRAVCSFLFGYDSRISDRDIYNLVNFAGNAPYSVETRDSRWV
jgi:hypothetical protein